MLLSANYCVSSVIACSCLQNVFTIGLLAHASRLSGSSSPDYRRHREDVAWWMMHKPEVRAQGKAEAEAGWDGRTAWVCASHHMGRVLPMSIDVCPCSC